MQAVFKYLISHMYSSFPKCNNHDMYSHLSGSMLGLGVTGMRAWRMAFSQQSACSRPIPDSAEFTMFSSAPPQVGS